MDELVADLARANAGIPIAELAGDVLLVPIPVKFVPANLQVNPPGRTAVNSLRLWLGLALFLASVNVRAATNEPAEDGESRSERRRRYDEANGRVSSTAA